MHFKANHMEYGALSLGKRAARRFGRRFMQSVALFCSLVKMPGKVRPAGLHWIHRCTASTRSGDTLNLVDYFRLE
jgi:hypothetical protein